MTGSDARHGNGRAYPGPGLDVLLEHLVKAALAEEAGGQPEPEPPPAADPADAFLARATSFLKGRADAAALLDRLRAAVLELPAPAALPPAGDGGPAGAGN